MTTSLILPRVYVDALASSAAVGIFVVNEFPERDSVEAARDGGVVIELTSTAAGDLAKYLATDIWINGVQAVIAGVLQSGFTGSVPGANAETLTYDFSPDADWTSEQLITVRVVGETATGTYTVDFTYTFTVEDITAPTLISANASDGETIRVVFSEGMLSSDASGATDALNPALYTLEFQPATATQAAVNASVAAVDKVSGTTFDLTTDIPLTFGKTYRLYGTGIADDSLAGNVVTAPLDWVEFTSWQPPRWSEIQFLDVYQWYARHHREQDISADLARWCSVLQDLVDWMWYDIWRMTDIWDVDVAEEYYLDLKLADLGNPFKLDLTVRQKRDLIGLLVSFYKKKGTAAGVVALADFFTDFNITEIRPWNEHTWILGESLLGIDTDLGIDSRAELYSFEVVVDKMLTDTERSTLIVLIDFIKPAHTHAYIVEPGDPYHVDHWDLGLSDLGDNTLLH